MKTKVINWTSKVNKYNSLEKMNNSQPGYKGPPLTHPSYWDYYLNYLTEARVNGTETNVNTIAEFKALKSYKHAWQDTNPDSGALVGKTNLLNPSIVKTMTCPMDSGSGNIYSGFRMEMKSTYQPNYPRKFNAIVIQLNKMDKKYIDSIKGAAFRFDYVVKVDDGNSVTPTNAVVKRIVFLNSMGYTYPEINDKDFHGSFGESATVGGNSQTATLTDYVVTGNYNLEEGLFVIDAELLKYLGLSDGLPYVNTTNSGQTLHHSFAFYKVQAVSGDPIPLEIANVTFTNYFEILLDEAVKYGRDNLTTFNQSKKTGIHFPDINEFNKDLEASISLMDALAVGQLDIHVLKNNMNTPFYLFPHCEPSANLTNAQTNTSLETYLSRTGNLSIGGLYILDPALDFSTPVWDNYNTKLKLKEYK